MRSPRPTEVGRETPQSSCSCRVQCRIKGTGPVPVPVPVPVRGPVLTKEFLLSSYLQMYESVEASVLCKTLRGM